MSNVQVIPAKKPRLSASVAAPVAKRRVAAYARVSTDSEEQLNSYEAQVSFYTDYIQGRADWTFMRVYTDEGISALNTKRRDGFNRMVADALDGHIDLIITKSVSRFARNTVDSLITIRKLKDAGVECYFEKEQIWTFDGKGELLLTIMSSLAQEESRSLSENVTWGKRKAMADGNIYLPWSRFLGYEKGEDGLPKIVPEQAEIVRTIFRLFMSGKSYSAIAKQLMAEKVPSPSGKEKWNLTTVRSILQNETYRGSKKLQKTYTTNYLTKSVKANEGELPCYFIEKSHEAIIPPDEWDAAQAEVARRKELMRPISCQSPLSTKIICGDCGAFFGGKVWSSNTPYRRVVWRCNARYKHRGNRDCKTPHVTEEDVKLGFGAAFNALISDRSALLDDCRAAKSVLCDTAEIDVEITALAQESELVEKSARQAIFAAAHEVGGSSDESDKYIKRHSEITSRVAMLEKARTERLCRSKTLEVFIRDIERGGEILTEWDEGLWAATVESVTVGVDGKLTFKFKNGGVVTV